MFTAATGLVSLLVNLTVTGILTLLFTSENITALVDFVFSVLVVLLRVERHDVEFQSVGSSLFDDFGERFPLAKSRATDATNDWHFDVLFYCFQMLDVVVKNVAAHIADEHVGCLAVVAHFLHTPCVLFDLFLEYGL